ncbi:serine protease gd-like [Zootermopsis nevadensis]|uniref:Serine protease gd n=1 Tax=Zootermopsis nevadensis TaxID=136037 RepID=A0A067RFB2_ZOONE|nr:serine protease gd-like [Zootermopsis nevadensis]KDR22457.1 Serine protease gd [Zootermopsis nevadensis]
MIAIVCGHILELLMIIGLEILGHSCGQKIPISPCPDVFQYKVDAGGMWYGLISVPPPEPDFNIKLTVKMYLNAVPPTNYVGTLHLVETKDEVWRRLITGDKRPVLYELYFPLSSPLPLVKHIALNKDVMCVGKPPRGMLTKISLEHNLFPIRLNFPHNENKSTTAPPDSIPNINRTEPTTDHECGISLKASIPLVVNGTPTRKGEWPWLVAMFVKSTSPGLKFQCGGSLLSTKVVLTAGHCIKPKDRPEVKAEFIVLFVGKHNLQEWAETNSQAKEVERIDIHPDYRREDLEADLAILILKEPVVYTLYVQPICLWHFSVDLNEIVGQIGTVVGWGIDKTGIISSKPNKVAMPIVSQQTCFFSKKEFTSFVKNRTFCAGSRDGTGPCRGDSGGGFVIGYPDGVRLRWYLRGVVHIALYNEENQQCDLQNYLVFTDVAKFMDWIRRYV